MRYYILAGEASGDVYAAMLVREIRHQDPAAIFRVWGGPALEGEGLKPARSLSQLAFMGFAEVVKHLPQIWDNARFFKKDVLDFGPDAVILIDYPGFNLRAAAYTHRHHLLNFYYISPQLWAWKGSRIQSVRSFIDCMVVIFPFEVAYYRDRGIAVNYYGHPLANKIQKYRLDHPRLSPHRGILALLPGSRDQEIKRHLPVFIELAHLLPQEEFVLAGLSSCKKIYSTHLIPQNVRIIYDDVYRVLNMARAAFVCSGTATLETALFQIPQAIVYKSSALSYFLGKKLVKLSAIGMPNLIAGKKFLPEFIQADAQARNLCNWLLSLDTNENIRSEIEGEYRKLFKILYNEHSIKNAVREMICHIELSNRK